MPDECRIRMLFLFGFSIRRFAIVLATRDEKKPEPKESDTVDESTGDYAKLGRGVAVHCCKEVGWEGRCVLEACLMAPREGGAKEAVASRVWC